MINYDKYSMHDFSRNIIIYYVHFLTATECSKIVSLPSIAAENRVGITTYRGWNLRPISISEF